MKKQLIALALCAGLLLPALAGCGGTPKDLMAGIEANAVTAEIAPDGAEVAAATDFAVRLFQQSLTQGENTLVSPLSVLYALAMTANGAGGATRSQMEAVIGLPVADYNQYLHAYAKTLPGGETNRLSIANAIWFKDSPDVRVERDFLQANADWYGAGIFQAPFNSGTLKAVNQWAADNTGGMITDILDEIHPDAVMYLVNAVAFDAEWQQIYEENRVREGQFTKEDGAVQTVKMMYSGENFYLQDNNATGFIKDYAGGQYAFAALLPKEGLRVDQYVASLTGEHLRSLLANAKEVEVHAALPKFHSGYSVKLDQILTNMGMTDAFDSDAADFSAMGKCGQGNLYLDSVLHKAAITVDERGTKAGAVTLAAFDQAADVPVDPKTVQLDRPFVYMIVDRAANLPIFIGTVMDVAQ